jgi:hypothetical protein
MTLSLIMVLKIAFIFRKNSQCTGIFFKVNVTVTFLLLKLR